MSEDLPQVKFIGPVRQVCEKVSSFMVMPSTPGKIRVFRSFSLSYILLVGSVPLPKFKLNRISQPISIEYRLAWLQSSCVWSLHGLNQTVYRTYNVENSEICPVFSYVSEQVSDVTLLEKNWIISEAKSQKYAMSAVQWKVIVFKPSKSCITRPMAALIGL